MNKFEFLNYTPTPGEKHLGIATVRIYGKIICRYKIVPTKDGSGFFPAAPSVKIGEGEQPYKSAFELDSRSEYEELTEIVKKHVRQAMLPSKNSASVQITEPATDMPYLDGCPF